jgi:hypothetical protein
MGWDKHVGFVECVALEFVDGRSDRPATLRQTRGGTGYIPLI